MPDSLLPVPPSLLEVDETGHRFIRFWNDTSHVKDLLR